MYCRILRRSIQLQNAFAFSFSNSFSSASARKGKTFTASYLVEYLGFAPKLAESISRRVSFEDKVNPDSVLRLLRSHGFTDSHISTIIIDYPKLLLTQDAEKSIGPKLQFLHSRGADEFTDIVSKVPKILGLKEDKTMSVYYDFVKEIVQADKHQNKSSLSHSCLAQGTRHENKIRNLLVLRDLGMPQNFLFSLLISSFTTLSGKQRFQESLNKVLDMGFDPTTYNFVRALNILYHLSDEKIEEKVSVFISLGFDVSNVWAIFKRYPQSLAHSVESVKMKTDFLVKKMNWPLKAVVSRPTVFNSNMEKKIVPRCHVIKALISKGLLGCELPPLSSVLAVSDEVFLNRYVRKQEDKLLVAELMAIFTAGPVSS